jgi:prepilin-type N-terminal cleavage/methylation domain-containing protein
MNKPIAQTPPQAGLRRGFTLIEVLTVITIIAVLMAAGAIGLGNLKAGKGTSSAVASCESLFEEARTIAVSNNCKSRIMVDARTGEDTYLRRVVVVRQQFDENTGNFTNDWVLVSRGYEMQQGTFFSQDYSDGTGGNGTVTKVTSMTFFNKDFEKVTPENPAPVAPRDLPDYEGDYYVYEFNGQGIFPAAGASFVVGAGRPPTAANSNKPMTTGSEARDFAGFVIWRNGRMSTYRNPEQIAGLPDGDSSFPF